VVATPPDGMAQIKSGLKSRLRYAAGCILLSGLGSALWLLPSGSGEIDHSLVPETNKTYIHDLMVNGGKAAVIADEFSRWYDSLWQPAHLPYTVAFLAGALAVMLWYIADGLDLDG
jgi:hypothetical protein